MLCIKPYFSFNYLGAPSVLFIDEIDGMVTNRDDSESSSGVQERVLSVLLNEMDGIGNNTQSSSREVSSKTIFISILIIDVRNMWKMRKKSVTRPQS